MDFKDDAVGLGLKTPFVAETPAARQDNVSIVKITSTSCSTNAESQVPAQQETNAAITRDRLRAEVKFENQPRVLHSTR